MHKNKVLIFHSILLLVLPYFTSSLHRLFSPAMGRQMDEFLRCYGDLLYVWNLLSARARLLKVVPEEAETAMGELVTPCASCAADVPLGRRCARCDKCAVLFGYRQREERPKMAACLCSVCREPVYGLTVMCELCGHQGHWEHLSEWFRSSEFCPKGCGCRCKMV